MIITDLKFKDRAAVAIQSDTLKATFLPDDGAKMVSLIRLCDGKELLAVKSGSAYKVLSYDGDYVSSECSGFDDMFPTVDPYTPPTGAYEGVTYPDHGETCRIPYQVTVEDECAVFRAQSRLFPIRYEKQVSVKGEALVLSYDIENFGDAPFDFLWAGHIMLQGEDGMEILTPFDADAHTEIMFAPKGVDTSTLPKDHLMGYAPSMGAAYKFYYTEPMKEGKFGVRYADGASLVFEVDEKKLPYLGLWLNNGEYQDHYTFTPEPCSVPFDAPDRAAKRGLTSVIAPHSRFSFELKIMIKESNI